MKIRMTEKKLNKVEKKELNQKMTLMAKENIYLEFTEYLVYS